MLLLISLFLTALVAAQPGGAAACLHNCTMEKNAEGAFDLRCRCGKPSALARSWQQGAATKSSMERVYIYVRSRMPAIPEEDVRAVANNSCKHSIEKSAGRKSAGSVKALADVETLPLCDCVLNRVHIPVEKQCRYTAAGEYLCNVHRIAGEWLASKPVRSPTLFDYQACVAGQRGYRAPATCRDASCSMKKPECGAGEELFNLADSGACCPAFVCKSVTARTERGGAFP